MTEKETNGISDKFLQQAEDEIKDALKSPRLSKIDRAQLQVNRNVLYFMRDERKRSARLEDEVKFIRKHSLLIWLKENKIMAGLLFSALMIINSYWNWAGLRQEWLGPLLNALGFHVIQVP